MSWCQACGAFVGRQQEECPGCGAPTRKGDKKSMHFDASSERMRQQSASVMTADYECRRFKLEPRRPSESDKEYCERVDKDKTAIMFKPPERIPGSDDDIE